MKRNFYIYILKNFFFLIYKKKKLIGQLVPTCYLTKLEISRISHHTAIKKVKIKGNLHEYYTSHNTKSPTALHMG